MTVIPAVRLQARDGMPVPYRQGPSKVDGGALSLQVPRARREARLPLPAG